MTLTAEMLQNAEADTATLAQVVNGPANATDVISRFGVHLPTVAKVLATATASLGYELPVAYAAGINVERATQTVENGGTVWAPLPSALPFVTGALFDASKWYVVQRQFSTASRAAMAGLPAVLGSTVVLAEAGREGVFVFDDSNLSAEVTVDTAEGVYVPPAGQDGTDGAWVRVHDGIILDGWFGTIGDGEHDDTLALHAASAFVTHFGGTLALDGSKTYLVGTQSFAGEPGHNYSYGPAVTGAISITGATRPVTIEGRGARMIYPDGYRYGSYDPVTGARYDPPTLPFNNLDYRAMMLDGMVRLQDNTAKVVVRNLELDGRATTAVLGGFYNDSGRQIPGSGVWAYGNTDYLLENIYAHDHPLDGWTQGWTGLTIADGRKKATAVNCDFILNCRQGLSQVGGNGLTAINCRFNRTGRGTFQSAPSAGVDLEAEDSIIRNTHFIDCEFSDNYAVGLLHGGGDVADILSTRCVFIGTTDFSVWPSAPRMAFDACTFVGCVVNTYTSAIANDACKFRNCTFTGDTAQSPTGEVFLYGSQILNLGGGDQNVLLDGCTMTTGGNMAALAIFANGGCIFRNCNIHQDNVTAGNFAYPRGFWHGVNILDGLFDFNGTNSTQNYGHIVYNGTAFDFSPPSDQMTPPSGEWTLHGNLFVDGVAFLPSMQVGAADFSNGTIDNFYRTGGAYVIDEYWIKKIDGTIVQVAQELAVGPDYNPYGRRIQGLGGIALGTFANYDAAVVTDLGLGIKAGMALRVGGVQVVGARQAAIADDASGAANQAKVNAILAALRAHGLIAP